MFVSIYHCWIILLKHLLLLLHAILSPPLVFLTLYHQPLVASRQETEAATPMTIATTMPETHHVLSSCWPCILSF
jgi:hypothetical protein